MSGAADAQEFVLGKATNVPKDAGVVRGYDFNQGVDFDKVLDQFFSSGFQASHFGRACKEVERMLDWNLAKEPVPEDEDEEFLSQEARENVKTKIWLAYTSNQISSGTREILRFLVQHNLVQVLVTTAGGIEEDIMKCMTPHLLGEFSYKGQALRGNGINRIGNMLVPNDAYCMFEDWVQPIISAMHDEQERDGTIWTPSSFIHRLGKEIDNEDSVLYWAYKNNIPIFCPALTDGSVGDMIYFHLYQRPGFILDTAGDIRKINDMATKSRKSGVIVLGGGVVKHHTLNANLMRNGADFCVYISTALEYDGSDSGASPDEAISWGKVRIDSKPVKVVGDATFLFPLLVGKTFAKKFHEEGLRREKGCVFDKSYTPSEQQVEREKVAAFRNAKF